MRRRGVVDAWSEEREVSFGLVSFPSLLHTFVVVAKSSSCYSFIYRHIIFWVYVSDSIVKYIIERSRLSHATILSIHYPIPGSPGDSNTSTTAIRSCTRQKNSPRYTPKHFDWFGYILRASRLP